MSVNGIRQWIKFRWAIMYRVRKSASPSVKFGLKIFICISRTDLHLLHSKYLQQIHWEAESPRTNVLISISTSHVSGLFYGGIHSMSSVEYVSHFLLLQGCQNFASSVGVVVQQLTQGFGCRWYTVCCVEIAQGTVIIDGWSCTGALIISAYLIYRVRSVNHR